jgi:hypothetical protein
MFSNIKAKLIRWRDLSPKDFVNLFAWPKRSACFNPFAPENYASSTLRVAKAVDDQGTVHAYVPCDQVLMVSSYVMRPGVPEHQSQIVGDVISARIEEEAQRLGITKMILIFPEDHPATFGGAWRTVRILEQTIDKAPSAKELGRYEAVQATTKFVN